MKKMNLPVLILKGIVLLPHNEIKMEFDSEINKSILDLSEFFHDNNILLVSAINPLEEVPKLKDLPKLGIVAKISHRMELPNGNTRILMKALYRAEIKKYLTSDDTLSDLESIISKIEIEEESTKEDRLLLRKIYRETESYIRNIPYMSNSLLPLIKTVDNLSDMIDIIIPHIPVDFERMVQYLMTIDAEKRAELVLEDLYQEKELLEMENEIDSRVRRELDKSQKEYLLREKIKVIKEELGDKIIKDDEVELLKEKVNKLKANKKVKERLYNEINRYEALTPSTPELNIVRNYIDWLLDLPWEKTTKDNDDLNVVKEILDQSHYGLDKVKTRIIEYLAVKKMTNSLKGPIICLVGPPGVGKTSLAISIAKSINRKFAKISVGGVNDESELIGHRRTYLGANPGRIIQQLKKVKSSNPVFLIDEIDKMTRDYKGDPASVLLEILDPEQNRYFSDNYIEEEFDLSKVLFVATANYLEDIPEPLRDRLEILHLSGYTEYEKLDIAKNHLLSESIKEHGLEENKILMSDEIILAIIRDYTKEAGVRELSRQISTIVRKIVTENVMSDNKPKKKKITSKDLIKYLGNPKFHYTKTLKDSKIGIVNGLAYTYYGGDTLPIEVTYYKGQGHLILTGSLGEVMKESAQAALSYLKANYKKYKLDYDLLVNNDIHIHVPEGAIPKDGPSAGVALTTAIYSVFSKTKIPIDVAMTGEITLRGEVLPIGGLKEKSIGAKRNNIKTVFIPKDNKNDLDEVPLEIKNSIDFILVEKYDDILEGLGDLK